MILQIITKYYTFWSVGKRNVQIQRFINAMSKRNGNSYGSLSTFMPELGINFILAYVSNT